MYIDSQSELDKIFMSYNKILLKFKALNIKTKNGKEITHKDLRKAISVMIKKHPFVDGRVKRLEVENIIFCLKDIYGLCMFTFNQKRIK